MNGIRLRRIMADMRTHPSRPDPVGPCTSRLERVRSTEWRKRTIECKPINYWAIDRFAVFPFNCFRLIRSGAWYSRRLPHVCRNHSLQCEINLTRSRICSYQSFVLHTFGTLASTVAALKEETVTEIMASKTVIINGSPIHLIRVKPSGKIRTKIKRSRYMYDLL